MLNELAPNLWETSQPLRFFGFQIGCRMTCVRLSSGDLLLHSPVRVSDELANAVTELGEVGWLVAPNAMHHLFIQDWKERFSEAELVIAPKLLKKRPDLTPARPLHERVSEWDGELEVERIDGIPFVDEFVFLHTASRSLILTDLAFHFGQEAPFLTRCLIRATGRLNQLAPTLTEKLMVRDRTALRASLERILEWDFDRVVVSHGTVLESGGREALARGFDWLL